MSRIPLGRAHSLASLVMRELRAAGVDGVDITPVGSLRRFAPDVGDVALFAAVDPSQRDGLLRTFTALPSRRLVLSKTDFGAAIDTDRGPVTLHVAPPHVAGAALVWLTGSIAHVHKLALLAAERGLRFERGRLLGSAGAEVPAETEETLYARLDLPYLAPELRHGEDELDAAREGRLPGLLTVLHLRGDLHMHTTWSDGRDSVADMVRASAELGYEYIAITDHSQSSASSRSLAVGDIPRQRQEIEAARRLHPGIRVLHGVEVDIMRDGALDFEDDVLAGFDFVLASLHDSAGQNGSRLTQRYVRAIESPYVDVVTHPMGRSPGTQYAYDLELDRLFAAAAETGTALEVDGAPGHLDMDGAVARRAADAGVTIVVDSDAHRTEALRRQMRFGVGTARRGWIEPRHVLNTRPFDQLLEHVARKRARA